MTDKDAFRAPVARVGAFDIDLGGRLRRVELTQTRNPGHWQALLDGRPMLLEASEVQPGVLALVIGRQSFRCVLDECPAETAVQVAGERFIFSINDPRSLAARRGRRGGAVGEQVVKAPMPGRVVRLLVAPGDQVETHQGVIVIEAMKMQNELKAFRSGRVRDVRAEPGSAVTAGQLLVVID